MKRVFLAAPLLLLMALAPAAAWAQSVQQALVDRSTLAIESILSGQNGHDAISVLKHARAVVICPRVFRAGFILGGEGGGCVLVARAGNGSWSDPAFYDMGGGSIGLQIGVQDAQVMMMIMNDKALSAVMDSQFKIGADASIAVATIGGSIGGSTTAAMHADIVTFALARGLFAGISLNGALLSADTGWNQTYYGQPYASRQIVVDMSANNPGANPLRAMLARYGG